MSDSLRRSQRVITQRQRQDNKEETKSAAKVVIKKNERKNELKERQKTVCDKCGSDGYKKLKTGAKKKNNCFKLQPCFDHSSQKTSNVCKNCLNRITRLKNLNDKQTKISIEEQKQKYQSNCQSFRLSLVQLLNNSAAERLFCPNMMKSGKACACLQRYIIGSDDNLEAKQRRAQHLLDLLIRAKHLSQQKCYSLSNPKSGQKIGLGNGHKKSKEFEAFVCNERNHLRNDLKFCEKAVQRVLFYSNNFMHKKLRTEPNGRQRVVRQKGKAVTGKLIPIESLANRLCCPKKCTQLATTHPQLLQEWRLRTAIGQQEARRVLAEMLTPTQALCTNCLNFISLVTGSSLRTISKVKDHLMSSGGNREPIEHGLKKFWFVSDEKKISNETLSVGQTFSDIQSTSTTEIVGRTQTSSPIEREIEISFIQKEHQNNRTVCQQNLISVINTGKKHSTPTFDQDNHT